MPYLFKTIKEDSYFKDVKIQFENENDELKNYLQTINSCHNKHLFPVLDSCNVEFLNARYGNSVSIAI